MIKTKTVDDFLSELEMMIEESNECKYGTLSTTTVQSYIDAIRNAYKNEVTDVATRVKQVDNMAKARFMVLEFVSRFISGNSIPADVNYVIQSRSDVITQEATAIRDCLTQP